ncbi:hypothetical protein EXS71_01635 [Candidatus Uhrbacteria bacterium]|nr:hypothetical protein [Candidatus Uhrbacteria bacterium]
MTAKRVQGRVCHGVELVAQSQKLLVGEIGEVGIDAAALLQSKHGASIKIGSRGKSGLFTDETKEGCIQPIRLLTSECLANQKYICAYRGVFV